MRKSCKPSRHPSTVGPLEKADLAISIFDDQDGKMVNGIVTEITATHFSLRCTDGQLRKFDIGRFERAWLSTRATSDRIFKSAGMDLY